MEDGSPADVAPEIFELSKDPVLWRQQRAAAIRSKILGSSSGHGPSQSSVSPPTQSFEQVTQSQAAVFAQLQALKRRGRNEGPLDPPMGPPSHKEDRRPDEECRRPAQPKPEMPGAGPATPGQFLPAALREKLMRASGAA